MRKDYPGYLSFTQKYISTYVKFVLISLVFLVVFIPAKGQTKSNLPAYKALPTSGSGKQVAVPEGDNKLGKAIEPDWLKSKAENSSQGQGGTQPGGKPVLQKKWVVDPFDQKVFVENNGQFDKEIEGNEKVLFQAPLRGIKAYFTAKGIVYRFDEYVKNKESEEELEKIKDPAEREKEEKKMDHFVHYLNCKWSGSNPDVSLTAEDEQVGQYTYTADIKGGTTRANTFKKIVYHNVYPGIDIEYTLPKGKIGLEYTIILHPGADLSELKMIYDGDKSLSINDSSNVIIATGNKMGNFKETPPLAFYQDDNVKVNVNAVVSGNQESFVINGSYDNTKTVVIDPFASVDPSFYAGGYDDAYDVDYDNYGDVLVYGGYAPFQLSKFNSAGTWQWTYNCPGSFDGTYYGDFAVDKATGRSYIVEGFWTNGIGAQALKISENGSYLASFGGSNSMREMWRACYNRCSGQVVIGGGGTNAPSGQAAMLDTNMAAIVPVNPLGTSEAYWDVDRMAVDPTGSPAYMAIGASSDLVYNYGWSVNSLNVLMSVPVPALNPANYVIQPTGDYFLEDEDVFYVGPGSSSGSATAIGMNGMAASSNWLYTYDGSTLKRENKGTGGVVSTVGISAPSYGGYNNLWVFWGGLDVDECDNIYVGNNKNLLTYNSSLTHIGTTGLPNTVFDIVLGVNDANLYVCGVGYLEALTNSISTVITTTSVITNTTCGGSNGSASASLTLCGSAAGGVAYLWEPGGQTGSTATNLGAGTYTVTMSLGCGNSYQATVSIAGSSNTPPTGTSAGSNSPVCAGGTLNLTGSATNATSWSWAGPNGFSSGGQNPSIGGVTAAAAGTYTLTAINACGSSTSTVTVTINTTPTGTSAGSNSPVCAGNTLNLTGSATGATSYSWSGPNGFSSGVQNPSIGGITAAGAGTYTLTATNACGSSTSTVTVAINTTPTATTAGSNSPVCLGSALNLTGSATGATSYSWSGPNGFVSASQNPSIGAVTAAAAGTYTLTATNACGSSTSTVTVVINTVPTATSAGSNSPVCAGGTLNLTGSATGATSYSWTGPNGFTSAVQNPSIGAITGAGAGVYTLTAHNACGTSTSTVTVVINTTPTAVSAGSNSPLCAGATLNLTGSATGATSYSWAGPNGFTSGAQNPSIAGITAAGAGTYTLTATNACGNSTSTVTVVINTTPTAVSAGSNSPVCVGSALNLTGSATGATSYSWTGPNGFTSAVQNPTIASTVLASAGTYTLTATNGCGNSTSTVTVVINNVPTAVAASSNSPLCPGATLNLLGSATNATSYSWAGPSGFTSAIQNPSIAGVTTAATGTYTLTAHNACGTSTSTVIVTINPTPTITIAPASPSICPGGNVTLTASGSSTYAWSTGATTSSINVSPASTKTYTVNGSSAAGCPAAPATVVVTVAATLNVTVTPGTPSICTGSSIILNANGAATYTWKPGTALSCTNCPSPTANPTVTTTYEVYGASGGCSDSAKVTLTVNPTPTVSINILSISASICPGDSLGMQASGATTYSWSPTTGLNCTSCATVYASPTTTTTYTVTGTDVGGCSATATQVVTVYPVPTVTVSPTSATLCGGASATLIAGGVSSYSWAPSTGLNVTTGSTVVATPSVSTTYIVTGKGVGGCKATDSAKITVDPTPTVTVSPSNPAICPGDSVSLTASGATGYTWSPTSGLNCNTCSSVYAIPNSTTTYTVVGTSALGCKDTTKVTVKVNSNPVITLTATPGVTICSTDTTKLTASGGTTYIWSPNIGISSTTGATVGVSPPVGTTTYTVTSTNASGCTGKDTAVILVNPKPTISISAGNDSICSGNSITISASGAGTYIWTPATTLSASTGSSVIATPTVTTTYSISGTSAAGCTSNTTAVVTVTPTPTLVVTPASPGICPGDSITLHVSGATTYSWNTGVTSDSLRVGPASSTTYTVTGNNGSCSSNSTVSINVGVLVVTVNATSSTICSGTKTTLVAKGAVTYSWKPSTGLSATTGSVVTATPLTTQTYTVVGTSGSGCSDSATVVITVNPTPTINVTAGSGTVCFGGTGTTLTGSGANTYSWNPVTGLSSGTDSVVTANPTTSQTYTITGTTTAGCPATATVTITVDKPLVTATATSVSICSGGSTTLNATGGTTYTWYPSAGLNVTTGASVTADTTASGSYWVVGTDALGCKDSANVNITVNSLPAVSVTASDTSLCGGNSATLTASGGNTYTWSPGTGLSATTGAVVTANPPSTQTYTVTGISAAGCTSTAQVTITVSSSPVISISLSGGSTLCPGASVIMTASGASAYTWSPSTGLSAVTGASVTATPPGSPMVYTVVGMNGTCSDSAKQTLTYYPPIVVTMPPIDTICGGRPTAVSASATGGDPAYTYSWTPPVGTGTGPYIVNPISTTTYSCTVTDQCGSTGTGTEVVFTKLPAIAKFTPSPDTVAGGQFITFIDSSTGASSWNWTFGDGNTSNAQNTYNQYFAQGGYLVTLIVSNGVGCSDTISDSVFVTEGIHVPNVFTPNNDGQNDVFHVSATGMKTYDIEIFNRWGEKVFESTSPFIDWDGRSMTGVLESDGTYYYEIKATDYKEKTYSLDGFVQLIRN